MISHSGNGKGKIICVEQKQTKISPDKKSRLKFIISNEDFRNQTQIATKVKAEISKNCQLTIVN